MAPAPVTLRRAAATVIPVAGRAVVAMWGPLVGGFIQNPYLAADQGIAEVETLYVDLSGNPAALRETATTFAVQPGETFILVGNQTTSVSVNAVTQGHKFAGVAIQPATPFPPKPLPGTFPPSGPTTLIATIPSYLYQEYNDDSDLEAFVGAYNVLAQVYAAWFANVQLPVYTSPTITGALLDWVAQGIYGMVRPSLASGLAHVVGPLNTYAFNTLTLNRRKTIGPTNVTVTSDDVFKRIMTWNFYKGDGNVFSIRWLKRRVMRFLTGANGSAPNIDNTLAISVSVGAGIISIKINAGTRTVVGGSLLNRFGFNSRVPLNTLTTRFVPNLNQFPLQNVLKEAIQAGVLQLPFQYQFVVTT